MVTRFNSPNAKPIQGGFGVPHIEDVRNHYFGNDFRHLAKDVDVVPPISLSGTTVQDVINELDYMIMAAGTGYIAIGDVDGYILGDYNVHSPATPTFREAMNAAIADPRLVNGGVIFIMAGTYSVDSTITIPAGISVMGEMAGTVIVGETTEQPMFRISMALDIPNIGGDSGSGEIASRNAAPLNYNKFFNLTLADNLYGNIKSGGNPISTMTTVPMIECEISSHFTCEEVRFMGRVNYGVVFGRLKTLRAIGYTAGGATPTTLNMHRCYFDAMRTAIDFSPGNGVSDTLNVDYCRARTFGTESATLTQSSNCFVSFSLCKATITNNYHVGIASTTLTVNSFAVITSGTANANINIVLTGNSGTPNAASVNYRRNLLYDMVPLDYVKTVRSGNTWGDGVNNEWFIVVGSAQPTANTFPGDFVGSKALDLIFTTIQAYPSTVILNPGTSNVTVGGNSGPSNLNIIGNKVRENYPIINLNISSVTPDPYIGNRYLQLGPTIKSVQFTSTARYHSVITSLNAASATTGKVDVEDCRFTDVALVGQKITSLAQQVLYYNITNCTFRQTATFADNISMLLPSAGDVVVENCNFSGNGYAGGIGGFATFYNHAAQLNPRFVVRNCIMDLTGTAPVITTRSPIFINKGVNFYDRYFWIKESAANVVIEGCKILVDSTFSTVTNVVDTALTHVGGVDAYFRYFIEIYCRNLLINNSIFNGPTQDFWNSVGTSYAMATLYVQTIVGFKIVDSRIFNGGLPLQLSGADLFTSSSFRGNCEITGCEFNCSDASICQTLIDIDYDITTLGLGSEPVFQVIMSNNNFIQRCTSPTSGVYHLNAAAPRYTVKGVIQAYVPGTDVQFNSNRMYATIAEGVLSPTFFYYAGVYLDNYTASGTTQNTNKPRAIFVHDNNLEITNLFTTADSDFASVLHVKSNILQIHNNRLNMYNNAVISTNSVLCLYIDNLPSTSTSYSEAIITDNIFSRRNPSTAALASLVGGYVIISAASGAGTMKNNAFDHYTYNGSSTAIISDLSTLWTIHSNKNQTAILQLKADHGQLGIQVPGASDGYCSAGVALGVVASYVAYKPLTGTAAFVFHYANADTTGPLRGFWSVPLNDILPERVQIIQIETYAEMDSVANVTQGDAWLLIQSTAGTEYVRSNILPAAPTQLLKDCTLAHIVTTIGYTGVIFSCTIAATAGPRTCSANGITVTYRWI